MAPDRTVADVRGAIETLDCGAWWRLRHEAREAFGKAAVDDPACDHEDLLQEALTRLLSGVRRWRRDRGFEAQVKSTMGSIASDWARRETSNPVTGERRSPRPRRPTTRTRRAWWRTRRRQSEGRITAWSRQPSWNRSSSSSPTTRTRWRSSAA